MSGSGTVIKTRKQLKECFHMLTFSDVELDNLANAVEIAEDANGRILSFVKKIKY